MINLRKKLPPLTSLAAFEAVSRLGSFTLAARELNLTQAAVSRQIIKLENDLGVALFKRRSKDVVLTPEGERFAHTVNPAVSAIGETAQIMRASGDKTNQLTVFSEMCMAAYWLVPCMPSFQASFPDVSIKLLTSNQPMEDFMGSFDIGFKYGAADERAFVPQSTWPDNVVVVCSPSFRRTLPNDCSIEDLQTSPLIHTHQTGAGWMSWAGFFERFGVSLEENKASLEVNAYNSAIDAAVSGSGLALGWRFLVNREIENGRLVQVGNFAVSSPDDFYAYSRKNNGKEKLVEKYIQWFKSEVEHNA
jgi:LysR family transcriptional regulator, glycine cleavage system transcriptional activator